VGVIYTLTNVATGKIYVGKTMIGAKERRKQHVAEMRAGGNTYLYRSMRKYGEENFVMDVVDFSLLEEELNDKEIAWIAKLDTTNDKKGYNCTIGGQGRIHTASSRARMKGRKCSPETRAKLVAANTGRKMPPESVEKMAASKRGKKHSLEVVARRGATLKKRFAEKPWFIPKPSPAGLIKIAETSRERMRDPKNRLNVGTKNKAWWDARPEKKKQTGEQVRSWWASHPEARAKISTRVWSEESRAKSRAAAVRGWEMRRAAVVGKVA
jgi:group I intron endonuclease